MDGGKPLTLRLDQEWRTVQLHFSTKGGRESAGHAARIYVDGCNHRCGLIQKKKRHAFNYIRKYTFLTAAGDRTLDQFWLLWQAYQQTTTFNFAEAMLYSVTGIQMGYPFGPRVFFLGIDEVAQAVESEFMVWYQDGGHHGDTLKKAYRTHSS